MVSRTDDGEEHCHCSEDPSKTLTAHEERAVARREEPNQPKETALQDSAAGCTHTCIHTHTHAHMVRHCYSDCFGLLCFGLLGHQKLTADEPDGCHGDREEAVRVHGDLDQSSCEGEE